ncbi:hypothetical protein XAB3213_170012 [Xanthomonas citri pv. bilvae]|nr:hypothetical protein XAB3213_170012 [Xanthomonas citri pv. bilvae]
MHSTTARRRRPIRWRCRVCRWAPARSCRGNWARHRRGRHRLAGSGRPRRGTTTPVHRQRPHAPAAQSTTVHPSTTSARSLPDSSKSIAARGHRAANIRNGMAMTAPRRHGSATCPARRRDGLHSLRGASLPVRRTLVTTGCTLMTQAVRRARRGRVAIHHWVACSGVRCVVQVRCNVDLAPATRCTWRARDHLERLGCT